VVAVTGAIVPDVSCASDTQAPPGAPGRLALEYGFRFASAIDNDPKDRQKAQQAVVMEYTRIGLMDEALQLARKIQGWRRGVALADIATLLAKEGREDAARATLAEAQKVRAETSGWEGPRIEAHMAQTHAALGEVDASGEITKDIATNDPRQYTGRAAATAAAGYGATGDFDEAMKILTALDGSRDREVAWWRTVGYLGLAREKRLDAAERRQALDAARRSAEDGLVAWKQSEALKSIAEEYRAAGAVVEARDSLTLASQGIEALPDTDALKPALLSSIARALADFGDTERVPALLDQAEALAPKVSNLDRPGVYANIASSWYVAGNNDGAWRVYDLAFDAAAQLRNPRPRAKALVAICRTLGRNQIELNHRARQRLDELLTELETP
jgi:tetratricopeptide (TPR) repeat protein